MISCDRIFLKIMILFECVNEPVLRKERKNERLTKKSHDFLSAPELMDSREPEVYRENMNCQRS